MPVVEVDGLGKVVPLGVAPRSAHEPVQEVLGHVHQHEAGKDLVGAEAVAQERRRRRPRSAAEHAQQQHGGNGQRRVPLGGQNGNGGARQGAGDELALGADVPEVGAEADRQTGADQRQRRGLDHQFLQRPQGGQRTDEVDVDAIQRIDAAGGEQDAPEQHGERQGDERRGHLHGPAALRAFLQHQLHAPASRPGAPPVSRAPAMSRPTRSRSMASAG